MTENNTLSSPIELLSIVDVIQRRIFFLLAFCVAGLISAYIFSKVVTPLYESAVVLYPSNSNSREKQLEDFSFGHEVQAERLMQLLSSNTMLDSLQARFDLAGHYGIDKSKVEWYDELLQMSRDRIQFHKNKYVSVTISVIDEDPRLCASIANEAARLVNVINADIVKNVARASLEVVEKEYKRRLGTVRSMDDSILDVAKLTVVAAESRMHDEVTAHQRRIVGLRDSLDRLRQEYNIYNFGDQINVLNEHLAEARANFLQENGILEELEKATTANDSLLQRHRSLRNGAQQRVKSFSTELMQLSSINRRYLALEGQLASETELLLNANESLQEYQMMADPNLESRKLNRLEESYRWDQLQTQELNAKYQRALGNYLDPVPAAIVVSEGKPSYKQIYPHTLVNLAIGGISSFCFGLLLFTYLDRRMVGAAA
jgi:capsular polysaccharide biosynthesis protein